MLKKAALLIGCAALAMIVLASVLVLGFRERIHQIHVMETDSAMRAALTIVEAHAARAEAEEITVEDAQRRALEALRGYRFDDGEGYVAVISDETRVLAHPISRELEGALSGEMQDVTGAYIVREAIAIGREGGIGRNSYYFAHPTTGEPELKTSAIARFDDWGWTLVAGVFETKVDAMVSEVVVTGVIVTIAMLFLFLLVARAVALSITRPAKALTASMTAISSGDLDAPIPSLGAPNEFGAMACALNTFRGNARKVEALRREKEAAQEALEQERTETAQRLRHDLASVLEAAAAGDFSRRVDSRLSDGNLRSLATAINRFVETVDTSMSAVRGSIKAIEGGTGRLERSQALTGAFADLIDFIDTTGEKIRQQADTLSYTSRHDALTGLANRRFFDEALAEKAKAHAAAGQPLALVQIDIDNFKRLNDTHGHAGGDFALQEVARRLRESFQGGDFIARLGGDEFVVAPAGGVDMETVSKRARSLLTRMREPCLYENADCQISCSIGVAVQEPDQIDTAALLSNADSALYRAKNAGRNRIEIFSETLHAELMVQKELAKDIARGVGANEFIPYFQPQFDANTLEVIGVEALARWRHPSRGVLAPIEFLGAAEESQMIATIDRQMLENALHLREHWRRPGKTTPRVSVNISESRLRDPSLLSFVSETVKEPNAVAFELVESIFLDELDDEVAAVVEKIKAAGIDLEVDDFGAGHASIISLLKLSPRRLKIDRRLVFPIVESEQQRKLIGSIVEIGQAFGIGITAEGVETAEHVEILRDLGCDVLQGFYFCRPLAPEAFLEFLYEEKWLAAA